MIKAHTVKLTYSSCTPLTEAWNPSRIALIAFLIFRTAFFRFLSGKESQLCIFNDVFL